MFLRPLLLLSFSPSDFLSIYYDLFIQIFLVHLSLLVGTCITDTANGKSSAYPQPNPGLWSAGSNETAFPFINTHTHTHTFRVLEPFACSILVLSLVFLSLHTVQSAFVLFHTYVDSEPCFCVAVDMPSCWLHLSNGFA